MYVLTSDGLINLCTYMPVCWADSLHLPTFEVFGIRYVLASTIILLIPVSLKVLNCCNDCFLVSTSGPQFVWTFLILNDIYHDHYYSNHLSVLVSEFLSV